MDTLQKNLKLALFAAMAFSVVEFIVGCVYFGRMSSFIAMLQAVTVLGLALIFARAANVPSRIELMPKHLAFSLLIQLVFIVCAYLHDMNTADSAFYVVITAMILVLLSFLAALIFAKLESDKLKVV